MGYKFTYKSLAELCQINLGKTPSRNKPEYWGEGVNWVSISDLKDKYISNTKEQITEEAITGANCKIVKKGTLLMSFKLSIGKLAFTEIDLFTNEAIAALPIIDESILDKDYLYYVLKFIPLVGGNQAVMGKTLNKQSLSNLQIPLPPTIDDQKRIAKVLSDCEAIIQKRKQSIDLLDELIQATFLDMFGNVLTNSKKYPTKKFSDIIKLKRGYDLPTSNRIAGDFPLCASNGIIDYVNEFKAIGPGLITGRSGTIGKVSLVNDNYWPLNTTLYSENYVGNPLYLKYFLQNFKLERFSNGAGVPTLNRNLFSNVDVMDVPIANQNSFGEIVSTINVSRDLKVKCLNELKNLFESLSQRAFKGKLDLSKVDISAMDDEKKKPSSEVTDDTTTSEEKLAEDRNKIIESSKEVQNDGSYLVPALQEYIEQSKRVLEKVNTIIKAGSEEFNSLESDLKLVNFAGSLVEEHINTLTPWQVYQHSYVERYVKHIPQELTDKYPNINLFSRREFDYSTMTLEEYLGVPDDVVAKYGSVGNDTMDMHFFFKKYFSDKSFTIDEVEELYNRIVYDDGDWFKYKPMKKFIFEAMKGDDAFITQVFEEQIDPDNKEIPKKLIKLKLIE